MDSLLIADRQRIRICLYAHLEFYFSTSRYRWVIYSHIGREAQCLWTVRHLVLTLLVPELYRWWQDNGQTFIYMELIDGITLEEGWPDLDIEEKINICVELRRMLSDLRRLRQDPTAPFIGRSTILHIYVGRESNLTV